MSFSNEREDRIQSNLNDEKLNNFAKGFTLGSTGPKYSYNFQWMGRPIIQYPQDIMAMQEIIWEVQPDLIIETGIAHGGSLIFLAAMLELNAVCGGHANGHVLGIDIDIRQHNKREIEAHPMFRRITMIQGSSISADTIDKVRNIAKNYKRILICLDSNHTHDHVMAELDAYADMTAVGSYCVVFDTLVEDMPDDAFPDRPWGVGNNPKTAVWQFLKTHPEFEIDKSIDGKILISVAPDGYLKRIA
jgi:cephalosporin hydroxylase